MTRRRLDLSARWRMFTGITSWTRLQSGIVHIRCFRSCSSLSCCNKQMMSITAQGRGRVIKRTSLQISLFHRSKPSAVQVINVLAMNHVVLLVIYDHSAVDVTVSAAKLHRKTTASASGCWCTDQPAAVARCVHLLSSEERIHSDDGRIIDSHFTCCLNWLEGIAGSKVRTIILFHV